MTTHATMTGPPATTSFIQNGLNGGPTAGNTTDDGFVGAILDRGVGEVCQDRRLVDDGPGELPGATGVEHSAAVRVIDDCVNQTSRADVELVRKAEQRCDVGHHDAAHDGPHYRVGVLERVGACGVARAHGEQTKVGMAACQGRYPQCTKIFRVGVSQHRGGAPAGVEGSVDDAGELVGGMVGEGWGWDAQLNNTTGSLAAGQHGRRAGA